MKNIIKNISYQMVYRVLAIITPLITSPLLSRALGVENLGIYSATQAYVNYFTLFAMLGVENYGNRTIAVIQNKRSEYQKTFWNIYAVQFSMALLVLVLYFASIPCLAEGRMQIALIQSLWLVSALLDINWFFFGLEQFKLTVTRNLIVKMLTVFSIVLFIRTPDDLWLYAVIMAGSTATSQILLWTMLPRFANFQRPKWTDIKPHILPIFKLFVPLLALSVFHIMDKTMLDALSNETNVGYYYSADKVINIPLGIITGVSTVMLPRIANVIHTRTVEEAKQMVSKSVELVTFLTAAISFGIGAIAREFVPIFFGPGFEACIELIYCFIPVLFVKAWSELIRTQYLVPTAHDKLYTIAVFCGAVVNIVANFILITKLGAKGAVLGTLAAETTVLIIQIVGIRNEVPFTKYFMSQSSYIVFGCIMLAAVRIVENHIAKTTVLTLLFLILFGGIIYMLLCFFRWILDKKSAFHFIIRQIWKNFNE